MSDLSRASVYQRCAQAMRWHPARLESACSRLLLHQDLGELKAIAGRVAKSGETNHAGNLFGFAFEFDAAGFEALAFGVDVIDAEDDGGAGFAAGVGIRCEADRGFALGPCEFDPALGFEDFLEAEGLAVEFLGLLEILDAEPRYDDLHGFLHLRQIEFRLLGSMSIGRGESAKMLQTRGLAAESANFSPVANDIYL